MLFMFSLAALLVIIIRSDLQTPRDKLPAPEPESTDPDAILAYARRTRDIGNYNEAKKLTEKSASMGSAVACMDMAKYSEDNNERFKWKLRAAELGNVDAMVWLTDAYVNGTGVLKSIAKSAQWLLRAAEAGHLESMLKLADAYASGSGASHNLVESLAWLYVAEFKGSIKAKALMNRGEKQINPTLVHLAQERAQAIIDLLKEGKTTADSVDNGAGNIPRQNHQHTVKPNRKPIGSGSGAIVSRDGHVVTAAHVVKEASFIEVVTPAGARPALVLSIDNHNDIALLKVDGPFENYIPTGRASDVRLGQSVSTIGFPNIGIQGQSPKVTQGMISSENGMQNDIRFWQISVPIQPGNSGGPLLTEKGELVGVIVSTLGLKAIEITGTVPQNVNYAIKANYLEPMLHVHKVMNSTQAPQATSFQDMIAQAQKSAVLILTY